MFSLTWPHEGVGTKLVAGDSEPSSTKATTATAVGDAALGVMLHRRLHLVPDTRRVDNVVVCYHPRLSQGFQLGVNTTEVPRTSYS